MAAREYAAVILAGGAARRLGGRDKPAEPVAGRPLVTRVAAAVPDATPLIVVGPRYPDLPHARYVREDPPGAGPVPALRAGLAALPDPPVSAAPSEAAPSRPGAATPSQGPSEVAPGQPGGATPSQGADGSMRGHADAGAPSQGAGGPVRGDADAGAALGTSDRGRGGGPAAGAAGAEWVVVLAGDLPFLREEHVRALLAAGRGFNGAVLVDETGREQWLAGVWRLPVLRGALAAYGGSSLGGVFAPLRPALVRLEAPQGGPAPWFDCDTPEDLERARRSGI